MGRRHIGRQRPQASKPHSKQRSEERDIFAVRRMISPISYPVFETIIKKLEPEVKNAARLFDVSALGITIIGFTRFDRRHRYKGPSTIEVIKKVPSASHEILARLGNMSVYGSGHKHKLGFTLESDELGAEVMAFEEAFKDKEITLKKDPNNTNDVINTHCSVALLYEDNLGFFQDERTLMRLSNIILDGIVQSPVLLESVMQP